MKKIKKFNAQCLCVTNNIDSYLYREADFKFDIQAGREYAIAATKTFSASVFMLWILAVKLLKNQNNDISSYKDKALEIKDYLNNVKNNIADIDIATEAIAKVSDFSICGYGINYPLAREAALKIKETCYINTSSYPMGEFIHGHFALLNKSKLLLTFLDENCTKKEIEILDKILSTYKTYSILISDGCEKQNCNILVKIPKAPSYIALLLAKIMTIQFLALKIAIKLKRNVDKPEGLNKVVDNSSK